MLACPLMIFELFVFLGGLYLLITGKLKLPNNLQLEGRPARLAGILLAAPLPLAVVRLVARSALSTQAQTSLGVVELALLLIGLISVPTIALLTKTTPKSAASAQTAPIAPALEKPAAPAPELPVDRPQLTQLRLILAERFDEEEFRTLCFDLGIDYDELRGEGQAAKARELVAYFERRQQVDKIIQAGRLQRPDIAWKELTPPIQ